MSIIMHRDYPHLMFRRHWNLGEKVLLLLGQCEGYVDSISSTPVLPDYHNQLLQVSLIRGAVATTAIEGNTLSEEDVFNIQKGHQMPPSKEYQEIEIKNILQAFNELLHEVAVEKKDYLIDEHLLKRLHGLVGQNLGKHFDAIPGKFRNDNRIVGKYRCPDYRDIPELIKKYCIWLKKEFNYNEGQSFSQRIIQAIVSHVYLEWIHPFGDGNGRVGRLLEFYVLLRGGNPDIASHILSNHYNQTRTEYYRQLDRAFQTRDLTDFIDYALLGFRDGLQSTLKIIQSSQMHITWQKLIYDKFANEKMKKKEVFIRRRELILSFPMDKGLTFEEINLINPRVARLYANVSGRTVLRDIENLIELELIVKKGQFYFSNINLLRVYIPRQK